jgi:S1-C subfamily serine protease
MKRRPLALLFVALCTALAAGCVPSKAQLNAAATRTAAALPASATSRPTSTPAPTRTPRPTPTPTFTPTPAPLTAAEIFERLSPSVVFVDTPAGTGSGVLIEGGYIVTNAHVVWPYTQARVAFAGGVEFLDVPVLNHDLLGDLALLGPLEAAAEPLPFADGEALVIGSPVYLIGYPGEVEQFPQPTIVSGVISRLREADAFGLTYFQTDAQVAGGQSGGVMVSDRGDLIGISGFSFSEVSFGLVASAADLWPRIEQLMAGEDPAHLGDRHLGLAGGEQDHTFELAGYWDARVYIVRAGVGAELRVTVESKNDAALQVLDVYGRQVLSLDAGSTGTEGGAVRLDLEMPYFVFVTQYTQGRGEFRLHSNHPLIAYADADDGRRLKPADALLASMDFPGDVDFYVLELDAGETVQLRTSSAMIDPYLTVDYEGAGEAQVIYDDDSGGGLFGLDAELTYRAPHAGQYQVVVADAHGASVGGYSLVLQAPAADAPTPSVPQPTLTPIDSPVGPMALYQSQRYPFAIEYPAGWDDYGAQPDQGVAASFGTDNAVLSLTESDLAAMAAEDFTLAEFADAFVRAMRATTPDFGVIARRQVQTLTGLDVVVIDYSMMGGTFRGSLLLFVHDARTGFVANYIAVAQDYQGLEPVFDYAISTFRLTPLE